MSERRLKLGHRKEYKRKSKHTRNPSYYPRHLTSNSLDLELMLMNKLLSLITTGFIFRFHVAKEVVTDTY